MKETIIYLCITTLQYHYFFHMFFTVPEHNIISSLSTQPPGKLLEIHFYDQHKGVLPIIGKFFKKWKFSNMIK